MAVVVRSLESTTARECFDASAIVTLDGRTERLTFRRYGDHPRLSDRNETFDPFAVALLVPAMIRGEPLVIEGGLDSLHLTRHRLLDEATPETLRVRLLVHHHVGAHGADDAVFTEQHGHAQRIADRLGVPLVGTRCSLSAAYRGMKFLHSVTLRNVGGDVTRLRKSAEVIHDDRLCRHVLVCVRGFRRGRSYAVLRTLRWALGPDRNENDVDLLRYMHARGFPLPTCARPAVALVLALHGRRHSLDPASLTIEAPDGSPGVRW